MTSLRRIQLALKAARQVGWGQVSQLALYRFGLATGHFRRSTPLMEYQPQSGKLGRIVTPPARPHAICLAEADEICQGKYRPFGGDLVDLDFSPAHPLQHWTSYEQGKARWGAADVKTIWEPARFGWAVILARVYAHTGEDGYAQAFWRLTEAFLAAHPPNRGPNWASAQEVALRLIALAFALPIFAAADATTPPRLELLTGALAAHAARIPLTRAYARAQNNNHLLSEAAGLYTAGSLLTGHPAADRWRAPGWELFTRTLLDQISPTGEYIQHSTNYHRLMLHLALWVQAVARANGEDFPPPLQAKLAAATRWLFDLTDPLSGKAANLGHNDGSNLFPLTNLPFDDYRPVLQAASLAFLGTPALPPGDWDELAAWFGLLNPGQPSHQPAPMPINRLLAEDMSSWATLRYVSYSSRPAHADQLHVDLWWQGENIALDAGTYQYNLPAPWDNSLAQTIVHNTITVDGENQMTRAGRFLWLDWAQGSVLPTTERLSITAEHDGYHRLGILHRRKLQCLPPNIWLVQDWLLPTTSPSSEHHFCLHWLLPDLPWKLTGTSLHLRHSKGSLHLEVETPHTVTPVTQVIRAGQCLHGRGDVPPILGWVSPTYGCKLPALSFRVCLTAIAPLTLTTRFRLQPDG